MVLYILKAIAILIIVFFFMFFMGYEIAKLIPWNNMYAFTARVLLLFIIMFAITTVLLAWLKGVPLC